MDLSIPLLQIINIAFRFDTMEYLCHTKAQVRPSCPRTPRRSASPIGTRSMAKINAWCYNHYVNSALFWPKGTRARGFK